MFSTIEAKQAWRMVCIVDNRVGLTGLPNHAQQHVHRFTHVREHACALSYLLLFCWCAGKSYFSASSDEGLLDKRPDAQAPGEPAAECRHYRS